LLYSAWADFDRAIAGLSAADAVDRRNGGNAIGWTVAHVTSTIDSWINVRFQGLAPNAVIAAHGFGSSGDAADWLAIQQAVAEVRSAARPYLDALAESDLDRTLPYTGGIAFLRERGFSLRYAVLRSSAHHYVHLGEVVALRARLGHQTGDFPGSMEACLPG
jgi:hypothetical protein